MNSDNLPKLDGFLPKQPSEIYPSPGKCIYCGTKDNLSDEHIIPFSLGGNLVLKDSSCHDCAKITSGFELTCSRTMYGPLRLLYDLPTRRQKKRPKKLSLKVKYSSDETEWQTTLVDQKKYPFLITFPYFDTPGIVERNQVHHSKGPVTERLWIRGASPYYSFNELMEKLLLELKAYSIFPESKAEIPAFCKLLAKIAHAFTVAKIGFSGFTPILEPIIIKNDLSHCMHYIGSPNNDEAPRHMLHDLNILEFNSINAILVLSTILCKLNKRAN